MRVTETGNRTRLRCHAPQTMTTQSRWRLGGWTTKTKVSYKFPASELSVGRRNWEQSRLLVQTFTGRDVHQRKLSLQILVPPRCHLTSQNLANKSLRRPDLTFRLRELLATEQAIPLLSASSRSSLCTASPPTNRPLATYPVRHVVETPGNLARNAEKAGLRDRKGLVLCLPYTYFSASLQPEIEHFTSLQRHSFCNPTGLIEPRCSVHSSFPQAGRPRRTCVASSPVRPRVPSPVKALPTF